MLLGNKKGGCGWGVGEQVGGGGGGGGMIEVEKKGAIVGRGVSCGGGGEGGRGEGAQKTRETGGDGGARC